MSIGDFLKKAPLYRAGKWAAENIEKHPTVAAGKWVGERTGLMETQEEKDLKKRIDDYRSDLEQRAETGVTPELREYARRAARARAALASRFSDRRLSPEQQARMTGQAQAQLSGNAASGIAELQRAGREMAENQLLALDNQDLARMDAEQARNLNALLSVLSTGAGMLAG